MDYGRHGLGDARYRERGLGGRRREELGRRAPGPGRCLDRQSIIFFAVFEPRAGMESFSSRPGSGVYLERMDHFEVFMEDLKLPA